MSFANFSPFWVLAGLAGLAAILYLIQWLRVRYQEIPVITTLFWREAVEEAPVRVFWQRFRHWLAYLLILAICALLWISMADPQLDNEQDGQTHVLLLDGSAGMMRGDRFQTTVSALKEKVEKLSKNHRKVLWCGATVKTLLNPGEHSVLLDKRLQQLEPEAAPASIERQLRHLGMSQNTQQTINVLVYGDAPVRQQVLNLLPSSIKVQRASELSSATGNKGVTALGISESASGAWDKIDVFIKAQNDNGNQLGVNDLKITIDDQLLPNTRLETTKQGGFVLRDIDADGRLLAVRLTAEDSLVLDNLAQVRLPNQPLIKVLLSESLRSQLQPVLAADPAVELTSENPDVVIRRRGENLAPDKPALEFVNAEQQEKSFLLTYPDDQQSTDVLSNAFQALALNQIDAMALAQASRRPIEVSVQSGSQWLFSVWQELLSDEYNFTQSRVFPLFMANSIRWLAGIKVWYPYVAAGQPLENHSLGHQQSFVDEQGRVFDTLGVSFIPRQSGELATQNSKPLVVSLLDPTVTTGKTSSTLEVANTAETSFVESANLVTWLLIIALMLLLTEWYFYQKGRMP